MTIPTRAPMVVKLSYYRNTGCTLRTWLMRRGVPAARAAEIEARRRWSTCAPVYETPFYRGDDMGVAA